MSDRTVRLPGVLGGDDGEPFECPEAEYHGKPFRYCPVKGCGWVEPPPEVARVDGTLPSGGDFGAVVSGRVVVLRVGDKFAVIHPQWMTRDQAALLADELRNAVGWRRES